jgi:hypothetical protein
MASGHGVNHIRELTAGKATASLFGALAAATSVYMFPPIASDVKRIN